MPHGSSTPTPEPNPEPTTPGPEVAANTTHPDGAVPATGAGASVSTSAPQSWLVPAFIVLTVIALIVLVLAIQPSTTNQADPEQPPVGTEQSTDTADQDTQGDTDAVEPPADVQGPDEVNIADIERRDPNDPLAVGPVDAPVVMVVFSDYQCPYCAKWSNDTLTVLENYVDAGDLRVEWRDVNIFGENSERAARASYAAGQQGQFLAYHHALFPGGEISSEQVLSEDGLITLAGDLGLDTDQFTKDLTSKDTAEEVAKNAQLGLDLGAYSTPAFLVGGQPIVGAQPTDVFTSAIDTALQG